MTTIVNFRIDTVQINPSNLNTVNYVIYPYGFESISNGGGTFSLSTYSGDIVAGINASTSAGISFILGELNSSYPLAGFVAGSVYIPPDLLNITKQPLATTLSDLSEITISGDVLSMMGAADIAGAASAFAAPMSVALALDTMAFEGVSDYYLKSSIDTLLSDKAAATHTHVANDISNATTVGKSLLTVADAATARSAIGAGTSSFSGDYADLTNKPSIPTSYYDLTTKPVAKTFDNAPSMTIQTVAAAANGVRLSTFRDSRVSYAFDIDTSVSLSGNQKGHLILEIAATNSTTAGDWKAIDWLSSGQAGTLVIGLVLNQTGGGNLTGKIPAGYYHRVRSVNDTGTPTYTYRAGQTVLDEPLQLAA